MDEEFNDRGRGSKNLLALLLLMQLFELLFVFTMIQMFRSVTG